jgi:hypothetical protein
LISLIFSFLYFGDFYGMPFLFLSFSHSLFPFFLLVKQKMSDNKESSLAKYEAIAHQTGVLIYANNKVIAVSFSSCLSFFSRFFSLINFFIIGVIFFRFF